MSENTFLSSTSRKRRSSDIIDELESSSSPHYDPLIRGVESCTSRWTNNTLNKLNIKSVTRKDFNPMDLIQLAFNVKDPNIKLRVERCKKLMTEHCVLGSSQKNILDVNDIEGLDSSTALKFMLVHFNNRLNHNVGFWNVHPLHNDDDLVKRISQKFGVHGELFAQNLINISYLKKSHDVTEFMFQNLFQEFAALFGLISLSKPFIAGSEIDVGKTTVSSCSAMIFPDFTSSSHEDDHLKLLAVCEVKNEIKPREEHNIDVPTEKGKKMKFIKDQSVWHVDDDLQGQMGGELFVHFPRSTNNGLLGMIVQRTNVTFCYFQCNKVQFEEIQTGDRRINKPVIYYSRPYNYLRAADREELMEPLLTLGLIQYSPSCVERKTPMRSVY